MQGIWSRIGRGGKRGANEVMRLKIGSKETDKMNWAGVPIDKIEAWQTAFETERNCLELRTACPICDQLSLRRYYYLGKPEFRLIKGVRYQSKGSVWEWCSNCRVYLHAQAFVPEAWGDFQLELDHSSLTPLPDVLDDLISIHKENNFNFLTKHRPI